MNYFIEFLKKTSNDLSDDDEVLIVKKIMENMDHLYELNLDDLAVMTYSSSATIIRFIKRLGFKSYSDFKSKVSVGYERNKIFKNGYLPSSHTTKTIISKEINNTIQSLERNISALNIELMKQLIKLIFNSKSVTIIGDYRSLEIFYVLNLTINIYGIPCYIFKQGSVLLEHLKLLTKDDLVIYIDNLEDYQNCISQNSEVKKVVIKVNPVKNHYFTNEETYQIIEDSDDTYLALLLIGKTIYNYFPIYMEGGKWHE